MSIQRDISAGTRKSVLFLPPLSAFSLLFAVQKPLVLLLIGIKQNVESRQRLRNVWEAWGKRKKTKTWNKFHCLGEMKPRALSRAGAV